MLKRIFLLSILTVLGSTTAAYAEDLSSATNDQILNELSRRLEGTRPRGGASVTYVCDSSASLVVSVVGPTGNGDKKTTYIGNAQNCASQATTLRAKKSKVRSVITIAICDSSASLLTYSISEAGTFGSSGNTYIGNMNSCLEQAGQINEN